MRATAHPLSSSLLISGLAGAMPAIALGFHLGGSLDWTRLMMPLSVFVITFGFTRWIAPRLAHPIRLVIGLAFGAVLAHLMLWLPLLLASYVGGQGIERLDYAIPAALFTSLAVGWYVFTAYLPVTVALCLILFGLIQLTRRHRRSL